MIRNISNSPNFGSSIVFNKTLYQGFNRAIIEARNGNNNIANEFANSVNYIKNDGKDDIYTVETRNSGYDRKNRCYLLKNGETIAHDDYGTLGENVMYLISCHAEEQSGKSMAFPPADVSAAKITELVNIVQKDLTNLDVAAKNIKTVAPRVSNAQKAMSNILKELETKKTKSLLAESEAESVVNKLKNIMGDKHFGEMI